MGTLRTCGIAVRLSIRLVVLRAATTMGLCGSTPASTRSLPLRCPVGLALWAYLLSLSLSLACALCVVRVLRYSEVLRLPGFEFYRSAEDSFCGERCRMCRRLLC